MKRSHMLIALCVCVVLGGIGAGIWFTQESTPQSAVWSADAQQLRALKEKWKTVIEEKGGEEAYSEFVREAPTQSLATHSQAHAFGEALYEVEGIEGLQACDSSFEFGCYHSFFGVAVHNEGIETLPQFDAACKDKFGSMNMPCQHGIGHGILVYTDYDNLEEALELCETISSQPTGGCKSGVLMEYNFHTMDESSAGTFIREPGKNLYEPCDSLPLRFQDACYFEQVQWWQNVYGDDFKKIGALCAALTPNSSTYVACYNGAGNYAAAAAALDFDKTISFCSLMPDETSKGLCHEGASWLFYADPQKKEFASQLCEALVEPHKNQCLLKLNFTP